MIKKACSRCGVCKPNEEFNRNRTKVGGRETECRGCKRVRRSLVRATHLCADETGKVCSACGQHKEFGEFHRNRERKNGYDNRCKICRKAHLTARLEKHKAICRRQQLFAIESRRVSQTPNPATKRLEDMSRAEREALPGYAALPPLDASDGTPLDG